MPNASTPKKRSKDVARFPHRNGQWCKTIREKQHYFGVAADSQAALKRHLDQ